MLWYYKSSDFQKKKDIHKKFQEILAHELVQPLLGMQSEGDDVLPGPGRNSISHEIQLKGKYFPTRVEKRNRCSLSRYKRNCNEKYKDTKTYNFYKKCNKYVCKDCFERFHTQSSI